MRKLVQLWPYFLRNVGWEGMWRHGKKAKVEMFMCLRSWFRRELLERERWKFKLLGARNLGAIFNAYFLVLYQVQEITKSCKFYLPNISWISSCLPIAITSIHQYYFSPYHSLPGILNGPFPLPFTKKTKQTKKHLGKRKPVYYSLC